MGSDIKKGSLVISQGTVISGTAGEIGVLASLGMTDSIKVYRKPIVGVLSTGDEVVDTLNGEKHLLEYGEIYDSNRPMLLETIRSWGFEAIDLGIARDVDAELSTTIQKSLSQVDQAVSLDPRPEYHRVHIAQDPTTGALVATSTGGQRSSRVGSIQGANGLLVLPSSHDAKRNRMEKGDILDAILINRL